MKIHITNLYYFGTAQPLLLQQHRFAEAGRQLGFYEMGIFRYPVETDSKAELSKRLDGVMASLESEDLVFVQIPTQNGLEYERLLLHKIKAYRDTGVILLCHETTFLRNADGTWKDDYLALFQMADALILPTKKDAGYFQTQDFPPLFFCDKVKLAERMAEEKTTAYGQQFCELYRKNVLAHARDAVSLEKRMMLFSDSEQLTLAIPDEIQIGFGLYDKTGNYSVWVGVAMQSIIEHTQANICFHILHDETLRESNRKKLFQVAARAQKRIQFHFLEQSMFEENREQMGGYTIGALFRILLPEVLPQLDKIIYLDADILVNRDIQELWETDISAYCMAAVPDVGIQSRSIRSVAVERNEVSASRYFNSGVLYMNLENIRKKGNMRKQVFAYLQRTRESTLPDQDALNVIYGEETLLLDGGWNRFVRPLQFIYSKQLEKNIYHYVGIKCLLYTQTSVDYLYHETAARTPWGKNTCREHLRMAVARSTDRIALLGRLIACCADGRKKHIFYGEETLAMQDMYALLGLRKGDYRVCSDAEKNHAGMLPVKEFSSLAEEKEPFLVFVLPEANHGRAMEDLERLGLKNETDFFVIPRITTIDKGGYL